MELTGDQFEQLEQALMSAYPKQESLKRMVRLGLDKVCLQDVNWDKPLTECVDQLIEWAEAQGKMIDLIRSAYRRNRTNKALKQFCATYQPVLLADTKDGERSSQPTTTFLSNAEEGEKLSNSISIFISYRRSDSEAMTGRIYDRLVNDFSRGQIFKDVDSIRLGVDFVEDLDQALKRCQVLLAIIGKSWVDAREEDGSRRIDNPNDFVRIEIESALNRKIPVVPVLLDGVCVPSTSELPDSIQVLARCQGMEVGQDPRFHDDITRLVKRLKREVPL